MNVSTKQLRGFLYASQLGSFTKAAERLHVTQAGLSAIMRALEEQLDARLFDRTTRSLALTEAGERLVPVAARILSDLDALAHQVAGIATRQRQVLRVGATPLVASRLLPAVCAALREEDPALTIQVVEIQRDPIQEQVLHGALDMGLGVFLAPKAGLRRRKLFSSRLYCVSALPAGGQRPARQEGSMRWAGLRGTPLVTLQPGNPVQDLIDRYLPAPPAGTQAARYAVNHMETQIAMAEIGTGVAIVPSFALQACRSYNVEARALRDPVVEMDFYGITRSGVGANQLAERFAATLVRVVKPLLQQP